MAALRLLLTVSPESFSPVLYEADRIAMVGSRVNGA